jgi:hypothetical protein
MRHFKTRKEKILEIAEEVALDILNEYFARHVVFQMIESGEITIEEISQKFTKTLENAYSVRNEPLS